MVTTFYPPHIGGIEYHVENLSRQLSKKGHKITVLTSVLPKQELPSAATCSDDIDVVRLKTFFPLGRIYPSLSSQGFTLNVRSTIKRLIKDKQIDLVHVHDHHYYLTWRAIAAAKKFSAPSVLTLHGLYALNPEDAIAQIEEEVFNRTIFRRELSDVNALIGLTPRITDYAKKYGSSSKNYFTIPNGVNYQVFTDNIKNKFSYRQKYGIGADKIVVLFRGRFASVKGARELAEAAKLVTKENNQIFFLFVGGGPLKTELTQILHPIKQNCRLIGWSPVDELHELYLASDIFVLPSKSEALPLTILEAMAARLHIVATPVGGIPDVLQKYPYKNYIKELSPKGICESILESIAETNKKAVAPQNEFYSYMKDFNWQKIASQVEDVYQSIVNKRNT